MTDLGIDGLFQGAQASAAPPGWSPESEQRFQLAMMSQPGWRDWYRGFMAHFGGRPNLDPGGDYDYRRAFMYGAVPQVDPGSGEYHGLSTTGYAPPPYREPLPLKAPDHATAWMEEFMQRFGIDPGVITAEQVQPAMIDFMRSQVPPVPRREGGF